jgi:ribosomal protein S30
LEVDGKIKMQSEPRHENRREYEKNAWQLKKRLQPDSNLARF